MQDDTVLDKDDIVDRRRVASMVEKMPGGNPTAILEIIDKYRQGDRMPGQLSDGLMSIRETDRNTDNEDGVSKNLLKTFKS